MEILVEIRRVGCSYFKCFLFKLELGFFLCGGRNQAEVSP